MRVVALLAIVVLAAALMTGCAGIYRAPVMPPLGLAFDQTSAPLDVNFDKTSLGSKTGEASSESILGLVAWGDCSAQTAAKNGGLKVINHADYKRFSVLGFYSKFTTVVYGD